MTFAGWLVPPWFPGWPLCFLPDSLYWGASQSNGHVSRPGLPSGSSAGYCCFKFLGLLLYSPHGCPCVPFRCPDYFFCPSLRVAKVPPFYALEAWDHVPHVTILSWVCLVLGVFRCLVQLGDVLCLVCWFCASLSGPPCDRVNSRHLFLFTVVMMSLFSASLLFWPVMGSAIGSGCCGSFPHLCFLEWWKVGMLRWGVDRAWCSSSESSQAWSCAADVLENHGKAGWHPKEVQSNLSDDCDLSSCSEWHDVVNILSASALYLLLHSFAYSFELLPCCTIRFKVSQCFHQGLQTSLFVTKFALLIVGPIWIPGMCHLFWLQWWLLPLLSFTPLTCFPPVINSGCSMLALSLWFRSSIGSFCNTSYVIVSLSMAVDLPLFVGGSNSNSNSNVSLFCQSLYHSQSSFGCGKQTTDSLPQWVHHVVFRLVVLQKFHLQEIHKSWL